MNDYPGTRRDPGQQLFDLLIGKRHTAACPVHLLVDADVAVAQTMQTDVAAQCGGGGRCRAFGVGVEQAAVFRRADRATCQRLICLLYVRITERNERVVALAAQNCGNTIFAQRRSAVAAPMKTAGATAADGYLLEAGEGIVLLIAYNHTCIRSVDVDPDRILRPGCSSQQQTRYHPDPCGNTDSIAMKHVVKNLCCALLVVGACSAFASTFPLPEDGSTMVGEIRVVVPTPDNTLLDIARHFDVGYEEIANANPGMSVWTPGKDARVVVPTRYILPPRPWKGIVVNLPQRRLYYFPPVRKGQRPEVVTYPVGIAREGWSTPLGESKLTAKYKDPAWFVPKSIREEHRQESGEELPEYFPPGRDNPMGMLALKTGFPSIFIHATNRPWGIGLRVSHGCLHLYPEDAAEVFPNIPVGTPVRFIDEPFVIGKDRQHWYMMSYLPLNEYSSALSKQTRAVASLQPLLGELLSLPATQRRDIDWGRVQWLAENPVSLPHGIQLGMTSVADQIAAIAAERYEYEPYGIDANTAALPDYEPGKAAPRETAAPAGSGDGAEDGARAGQSRN